MKVSPRMFRVYYYHFTFRMTGMLMLIVIANDHDGGGGFMACGPDHRIAILPYLSHSEQLIRGDIEI